MLNDVWELVKTVTAEYITYSDFDISEIITDYNNDNLTKYKLEDIEPMFQDAPPNCKKIWKHENSTNNS